MDTIIGQMDLSEIEISESLLKNAQEKSPLQQSLKNNNVSVSEKKYSLTIQVESLDVILG